MNFTDLPLLDTMRTRMSFLSARQTVLSQNVANADTPNYKAKDVDFRAALQGALKASTSAVALATTQPGHIQGGGAPTLEGLTGYRRELQSAVDGNTVNMDVERAAFAENALHYEASVTFINGMLRSMNTAITGQ